MIRFAATKGRGPVRTSGPIGVEECLNEAPVETDSRRSEEHLYRLPPKCLKHRARTDTDLSDIDDHRSISIDRCMVQDPNGEIQARRINPMWKNLVP